MLPMGWGRGVGQRILNKTERRGVYRVNRLFLLRISSLHKNIKYHPYQIQFPTEKVLTAFMNALLQFTAASNESNN